MTQVGETLRRERIKRNLDFEQISRELKISARFLEAIENDQYEKLPGGVFAKSFVRQYARLLGLDEEELAGQVQSQLSPVADVPQFAETSKAAGLAPIQVPRVEEWETVGDRRFRWGGSLSAAAMVVVVMLVCSAVYTWIQRRNNAPTVVQSTPPATAPAPPQVQPAAPPPAATPAPTEATPGATVNASAQPPAQPVPEASPQSTGQAAGQTTPQPSAPGLQPAPAQTAEQKPTVQQPAAPNPNATVHVEITAEEPVWVLARTDGKYSFSATLTAGQSRNVEAVKDIVLRLGNAGGVQITLNGKPLGAVGPKGQPRTIQLTSGGFQIVPAKPPSAVPLDPLDRF